MPLLRYLWNSRTVKNGNHTVRFLVADDLGRQFWTDPQVFVVNNPEINIMATDEDSWQVTRRKTDTGKVNKLEVDKSVTVRINGKWM